MHLVGDVHQPLHSAQRGKNRGGNGREVLYQGRSQPANLHSARDTLLVSDLVARRRVADAAAALAKTITPQQRKQWLQGTAEQWANETHNAAMEVANKVSSAACLKGTGPSAGADGPVRA